MIGVDELSQNVHTLVTNPQKEIMFRVVSPLSVLSLFLVVSCSPEACDRLLTKYQKMGSSLMLGRTSGVLTSPCLICRGSILSSAVIRVRTEQ